MTRRIPWWERLTTFRQRPASPSPTPTNQTSGHSAVCSTNSARSDIPSKPKILSPFCIRSSRRRSKLSPSSIRRNFRTLSGRYFSFLAHYYKRSPKIGPLLKKFSIVLLFRGQWRSLPKIIRLLRPHLCRLRWKWFNRKKAWTLKGCKIKR